MFKTKLLTAYLMKLSNVPLKRTHLCYTTNVLCSDYLISIEIRGERLKYPYVWLRDNCQCNECFHPTAKSRTLSWNNFDCNVKPKDISTTEESLTVIWNDGHVSRYRFNWLKLRGFAKENQESYDETIFKPPKITWKGNDFNNVMTKHDYYKILRSKKSLYEWLHMLSVYGVALIQNSPPEEDAVECIAKMIGFTKRTHYGSKFIVHNVVNTSNVAYLSTDLQMHTDLPYYEYCPGVNLLHCLVQTKSKGGVNLLSDSHYVAEYMKLHHPEEYRLLTDIQVEWSDVGTEDGNEFYKLHRAPVISIDVRGKVARINFSIPQRGSHFPCDLEKVKPWYEAHGMFLTLNQRFSAEFKSEEGDILCFDNTRLLHGRSAYYDNPNNTRRLIGVYLDWDEIYSRLRCLIVKSKNIDGV